MPSHTTEQRIPVVTTAYARLMNLFEALWDTPGHSDSTLFEFSTPGATQALRDWAAMRGFEVTDRIVTPPGVAAFRVVKVITRKLDAAANLVISVQGARGVES
jgi:hypothetical protein